MQTKGRIMHDTVREVEREPIKKEEAIARQLSRESEFAKAAVNKGEKLIVHAVEPLFKECFYKLIISPKTYRGNTRYVYAYVEARDTKNSALVFTYTPQMADQSAKYGAYWLYKEECNPLTEEETLAMCRRIFETLLAA